MKDYAYFIPGYTGFCPLLREHFGQTYGHATRHIIQEEPYLKDRLAPVFYNYRRSGFDKNVRGKYGDNERYGMDPLRVKRLMEILDPCAMKYRTDYDDSDARERKYGKHEDATPRKCKYGVIHGNTNVNKRKNLKQYEDGDRTRKEDRECMHPRLIYIESYAEYTPELWNFGGKLETHHDPCVAPSCARFKGYSEDPCPQRFTNIRGKRETRHDPYAAVPCVHLKECSEDPYLKRSINRDPRMYRVPRVKPHRQGGVIPKYTGHIPAMKYSFGESYGPLSDRLLRKHHDCMNQLKRKF